MNRPCLRCEELERALESEINLTRERVTALLLQADRTAMQAAADARHNERERCRALVQEWVKGVEDVEVLDSHIATGKLPAAWRADLGDKVPT